MYRAIYLDEAGRIYDRGPGYAESDEAYDEVLRFVLMGIDRHGSSTNISYRKARVEEIPHTEFSAASLLSDCVQ